MHSSWSWLEGTASEVAPRLLGCHITRQIGGRQLTGRIVEVEAYDQTDAASHSYSGPIEARTGPAEGVRNQSGNFFHPAVGIATPGQNKIAISTPATPIGHQPEPRLRQGQTPRTAVMFGPAGHLYVYFTYGMHYCCNVVVGKAGMGAAVLIRALEPLAGQGLMQQNRGGRTLRELTNGPAKVCQALAIDKQLNGHDLHEAPLRLEKIELSPDELVVQTVRIGISRERQKPWRFYIQDNPWVSKP